MGLLEIRALKTHYHTVEGIVRAVDEIDLYVERGETLGLVGESGCGKSTVGLSILRLVQPPGRIAGGHMIFDGEDLLLKRQREMEKIRGRKISMVFQNPMSSLNPVFTIREQVAEAIRLHQDISRNEVSSMVVSLLERAGIPDPWNRMKDYPHEYSGGMRQRAMIAMAISCNPLLLIADEPTTSLDVTIQAQILELMKNLKRELKMSTMLITHDLGLVAELCDRVAVMYAGKIVECSDVGTIFKRPVHPYTEALLKATLTTLGTRVREFYSIRGFVPDLISPPRGCRFQPRCDYATDLCSKEPPEVEVDSGHRVCCFRAAQRYLDEA